MSQYIYGKRVVDVAPAEGVSGMLLRSVGGRYFFRIDAADHSFVDYDLRRDDLAVTIDPDALASFYTFENNSGHRILDHSPNVLGLTPVTKDK